MTSPALPELLTPLDVATWLAIPSRRVERLAKQGRIPCIVLPGGDIVFRADELSKWLDSLGEGPREAVHA